MMLNLSSSAPTIEGSKRPFDPATVRRKCEWFSCKDRNTSVLARLFSVGFSVLLVSSCTLVQDTKDTPSVQTVKNEPKIRVIRTPHGDIYQKEEPMPAPLTEPPANLEEMLQQQAVIGNIMVFLKEEIQRADAADFIQRAEARFNVEYTFVANRPALTGKVPFTDFLIDNKLDENGKPYEGGRVDFYDGGQIPGTVYSTFYEVYSEGAGPKYIDLLIQYDKRNGGVCLNGSDYSGFVREQGFEPAGGVEHGILSAGIFVSPKVSALYQADDSGDRHNREIFRYSRGEPFVARIVDRAMCAKKIGLRIKYQQVKL